MASLFIQQTPATQKLGGLKVMTHKMMEEMTMMMMKALMTQLQKKAKSMSRTKIPMKMKMEDQVAAMMTMKKTMLMERMV